MSNSAERISPVDEAMRISRINKEINEQNQRRIAYERAHKSAADSFADRSNVSQTVIDRWYFSQYPNKRRLGSSQPKSTSDDLVTPSGQH